MFYPDFIRRSDPFAFTRLMLHIPKPANSALGVPRAFPAVTVWQPDEAVEITAELPDVAPTNSDSLVQGNVARGDAAA